MGKEITIKHLCIDYFICYLCKTTANDPVQCRLCEKLFCYSCLASYLNSTQSSCCPLGCYEPTFEKACHAFNKLMAHVYVRCKYPGCNYEDCIKLVQKHEQICRFKQEKMEIETNDEIAQRDLFWIQIISKIMTPLHNNYSSNFGPSSSIAQSPYSGSITPSPFAPSQPKTPQSFKF